MLEEMMLKSSSGWQKAVNAPLGCIQGVLVNDPSDANDAGAQVRGMGLLFLPN